MKVVSNIFFQGSGFIRSEMIDQTFPKCSTRDKINGMIPRLVLWEAMCYDQKKGSRWVSNVYYSVWIDYTWTVTYTE